MKPAAGEAALLCERDPEGIPAFLFFGPNQGLARDRMEALAARVLGTPPDAMRLITLSGAGAPASLRFLHEAAGTPDLFSPGRRVICMHDAGDHLKAMLAAFLAAPPPDCLLLASAGELGTKSPLRQLFETHRTAVAIGCYPDEGAALLSFARSFLDRNGGLRLAPGAARLLPSLLGRDRDINRRELEKLVLYAGNSREPIQAADVRACLADVSAGGTDEMARAIMTGALDTLGRLLAREPDSGLPGLLRLLQREFRRLEDGLFLLETGLSPREVTRRQRPPLHFGRAAAFEKALGLWNRTKIRRVREILVETEIATRTTGMPAGLLCRHSFLRIARAAGSDGNPPGTDPPGTDPARPVRT